MSDEPVMVNARCWHGRFEYRCMVGHHVVSSLPFLDDCPAQLGANRVVLAHDGMVDVDETQCDFGLCGRVGATYYLSTPNFDPRVGAAGNHTFDSGDGRGEQPQELEHMELEHLLIQAGFVIKRKFGTFASKRDYAPTLEPWQEQARAALSEYYDANLVSNLMAPMVPAEQARNCLWVLEAA